MVNNSFSSTSAEYYTRFKWWMLPLISEGPNIILDIGCASGVLGRKLMDAGRAKAVFGAEIFPEAAKLAAESYVKVYVGDVEDLLIEEENTFDYVICGDVLEHLKDPYVVLERIYRWLKPGGKILICVPNIRHYRVIFDLLFKGKWEYASAGILDQTHLRFFTLDSCVQMMKVKGFKVYHQRMIVEGPKKNFFNRITFKLFSELLGSQIFCCGEKPLLNK